MHTGGKPPALAGQGKNPKIQRACVFAVTSERKRVASSVPLQAMYGVSVSPADYKPEDLEALQELLCPTRAVLSHW